MPAAYGGDDTFSFKIHDLCLLYNDSFCLLEAKQQGFSLSRCIYKKHKIMSAVCAYNNFFRISSFFFFSCKAISSKNKSIDVNSI